MEERTAKTKFLWLVPPRRRHQLPPDHLVVGPVRVAPVASARDLGVYLDCDMMKTHVTRLVSSCCGILRQIRSIRRPLPRSTLTMLISSFRKQTWTIIRLLYQIIYPELIYQLMPYTALMVAVISTTCS